ncbi:MAG: hypothetical protein IPO88_25365 [Nannocystis sp.]|uniref:hypothetical protein n=1 Tax=Nannocystis sp. TaxID=1962667 RepID=UPI002424D97D|nr:hypothetical protein [Nannocystis sp.]MBK9756767.1 hypothetical protein [Nannocystis sp.]
MSLLLVGSLLLAPVEAPGPTVWAEAGGRPWTGCRERERQAEGILQRVSTQSEESSGESPWAALARDCPNAPSVLVLAAMRELVKVPSYPPQIDLIDGLPRLAEIYRESRLQARTWLTRALIEAERRGEPPPVLTYYFLGYAALGLGDASTARAALAEAERRGEVEGWRADRAAAVAALLAGELPRALELAYRARELAPTAQRATSVYVLALVYDRAGAPETAQRELLALRAPGSERGAVDTLLPLHERLYLNALEQQAARNNGSAARLWEAYLALPEPEAPERALAERRLAELRPRGSLVPGVGR